MELLTDKEVSEIFKVSENTVVSWVHRKQIPEEVIFKLPGKRTTRRFIKSKLEDWINGNLQTQ